jgi:hypothetical protein
MFSPVVSASSQWVWCSLSMLQKLLFGVVVASLILATRAAHADGDWCDLKPNGTTCWSGECAPCVTGVFFNITWSFTFCRTACWYNKLNCQACKREQCDGIGCYKDCTSGTITLPHSSNECVSCQSGYASPPACNYPVKCLNGTEVNGACQCTAGQHSILVPRPDGSASYECALCPAGQHMSTARAPAPGYLCDHCVGDAWSTAGSAECTERCPQGMTCADGVAIPDIDTDVRVRRAGIYVSVVTSALSFVGVLITSGVAIFKLRRDFPGKPITCRMFMRETLPCGSRCIALPPGYIEPEAARNNTVNGSTGPTEDLEPHKSSVRVDQHYIRLPAGAAADSAAASNK